MKHNNQQQSTIKNFIDPHEFWQMVDDQIQQWLHNYAPDHFIIETAKKEGWLGSALPSMNRDHFGLLGYMRTNFACQLKIKNDWGNYVPVYIPEFYQFFKSDYFTKSVKNGEGINFKLHPKYYNDKQIDYLEKVKNFTMSIAEETINNLK